MRSTPPPGSRLGEVVSGLAVPLLPAAELAERMEGLRAEATILGTRRPGGQQFIGLRAVPGC
jgi:hypothetical protein